MERLAGAIFRHLRNMDREAIPRPDSVPTGLAWYGAHARPELKKPQTEVEWSNRLAALLTGTGTPTLRELAYPGPHRRRCDLCLELSDGRFWLELKGAWKEWWVRQGDMSTYLRHLHESTAADLRKLEDLSPPQATRVGLLLVGFDTPADPMQADVSSFVDKNGLAETEWQSFGDHWEDYWQPGRRVHAWLWVKAVSAFVSALDGS